MSFSVSPEFGYVILTAIALQMQVTATTFTIGKMRRKHGIKYPDMGNGRFSAKLTEDDWQEFNIAQRVHQNYIENLTTITTNLLVSGLSFPVPAASLGAVYFVSRFLYGRGYFSKEGPSGRTTGAVMGFLVSFSLMGLSAWSAVKLLGLF